MKTALKIASVVLLVVCSAGTGYWRGCKWANMQSYAIGYDDGFYSSKSLLIPNTKIFDATTGKHYLITEVDTEEPTP